MQAVQGRCTKEGLADDFGFKRAIRGVDDVIRAQQDINSPAGWPAISPVAAQYAQLGLYRLRAEQLPTNEIALADKARYIWRQRLVVKVVGRIPLFQATLFKHPYVITDGEGFFLVVGHQNGTGTARF